MNTPECADFVAQLADLKIPPDISKWLYWTMRQEGIRQPSIESKNDLESAYWYDLIIQGTIELCHFRPHFEEVDAICRKHIDAKGHKFEKFIDFAIVIAALREQGPDVGDEVIGICPSRYNEHTRELWLELCQLSSDMYGDQFMIKCYLNKSLLEQVHRRRKFIDRFQNFWGRIFFWLSFSELNSHGIESNLKRYGYQFFSISNLSDYAAKRGDVIKIVKKGRDDRFKLFALVSEVTDNKISQIQFKTSYNAPLQSTMKGFDLFFFRDPKTRLEGVWTKP